MTEMLSLLSSLPEEGRVSRYRLQNRNWAGISSLSLQCYRKNFHVIYLVRDPRGIINSVKALEEQWPDRLLDPTHICSRCCWLLACDMQGVKKESIFFLFAECSMTLKFFIIVQSKIWRCSSKLSRYLYFISKLMSINLHTYIFFRAAHDQKISDVFTITEKAPTRAFSRLKVPTSTFTFMRLLN